VFGEISGFLIEYNLFKLIRLLPPKMAKSGEEFCKNNLGNFSVY